MLLSAETILLTSLILQRMIMPYRVKLSHGTAYIRNEFETTIGGKKNPNPRRIYNGARQGHYHSLQDQRYK